MITVFQKQDKIIKLIEITSKDTLPDDVIWVDIELPTEQDLARVQQQLGIELPSKKEVWKNHTLNRLYMEDGVAYMTAAIIKKTDTPYPQVHAVTFILTPKTLLTIHDISPTSFHIFAQRLQYPRETFPSSAAVLEGLLEEMITRVAHNSEIIEETLDQLSHRIFGTDVLEKKAENSSQSMKNILKSMGSCADLNSKINESLHSINRLLHFFKHSVPQARPLENNIDILISDTQVLTQQTDFDAEKIAFQLNATLGMINVEQNVIIKMFSVVAVFFMPPTLVASLYGMNFKHMPELEWTNGYPMAISLMVLFALLPYLYFRKKGWM